MSRTATTSSPAASASGLVWRQLVLPVPVDEARVRSFLTALATMAGHPLVVFEAIGHAGRVHWRIGTRAAAVKAVQALALAHLPGVRLTDPSEQAISNLTEPLVAHPAGFLAEDVVATQLPAAAARVQVHGRGGWQPLAVEATLAVTRSLLAVLASTSTGEYVRLQLVCGARLGPRTPPSADGDRGHAPAPTREVVQTLREPGFQTTIRLAASAGTPTRADLLVRQLSRALTGLNRPRLRLETWVSSPRAVAEATTAWLFPTRLRTSELPALMAWPLEDGLPGVAAPHPVTLPPSLAIPSRGRPLGVAETDPTRPVALSREDGLRHLHLLGPTGTGKSTVMANLVLADIAAGDRVVVIDPKGDLVTDIARRVPEAQRDRVVIIDAADPVPVGINPLAGSREPELAAEVLLGMFRSLYADSWGPRTQDILHACLLTLARRGDASLVMVPLLLTNPGFRRSVTSRVAKADPLGLGGFWAWYEALSDGERSQAIAPLLNKLRPVLLRPQLRAVFGQRTPKFDLHTLFNPTTDSDEDAAPRAVLVNLAKGRLGEEAARLLGSVVVGLVWQAALARIGTPAGQRAPVWVHIDEIQDYLRLPGDLGDALAQARGLGVGFTLAHQHLGQLPRGLRDGVLANARSRVAFSLSRDDARVIAEFSGGRLEAEDYRSLPAFHAYATVLADAGLQPPLSMLTRPLDPPRWPVADVLASSRARWGQALDAVEADLLNLAGHPGSNDAGEVPIGRSRPTDHTPREGSA
ncbi:type IV secretory system conjugative DNA transfer family protein [Mariniluteicoccus endophyticus]